MWQYWPLFLLLAFWAWLWWYTRRPSARAKAFMRAMNPSGSLLTDYEHEIEQLRAVLRAAPMPERESVLKGEDWHERYDAWWHDYASEDALGKEK